MARLFAAPLVDLLLADELVALLFAAPLVAALARLTTGRLSAAAATEITASFSAFMVYSLNVNLKLSRYDRIAYFSVLVEQMIAVPIPLKIVSAQPESRAGGCPMKVCLRASNRFCPCLFRVSR